MGLFGAGKSIVDGVVALRYEANVDQAKAAIKDLSGAQKKAAKEAAEAYKAEGEAFAKKSAQIGKGLAIIATGVAVAKTSLDQYRKESALTAAAVGVDVDRLGQRWDGLKTRMELLTLAQAGHRGAWKLTTAQLEQVSDGMRALEAKGYDATKVFDKFTDVLKKGKVEGLDDFGLSIKSTGDQTKDLQVLLRALGREVTDVGGHFNSATDPIDRATVAWTDAVNRVRFAIGQTVNDLGTLAAAAGKYAGMFFGGGGDSGQSAADDRIDAYAKALSNRRGITISGARSAEASAARRLGGAGFQAAISGGPFAGVAGSLGADRQLFGGPSDADVAGARALAAFRGSVRRGLAGSGPLAAASPEDFAKAMQGLPQDWQQVDAGLASMVDSLRESSQGKWMLAMYKWGMSARRAAEDGASGGGGGKRADIGPGLFFGARDRIVGAVDSLAALEAERSAGAASAQARLDALGNAGMMSDIDAAKESAQQIQASFDAVARLEADKRESFLQRNFGKLEEFEAYAEAFDTLAAVGSSAWSAFYDAVVTGEESLGSAVKKAIAVALGAKAKEFGAEGLMMLLKGTAYTVAGSPKGPAMMAAGSAMMAGAVVVGSIAASMGGGSSSAPSGAAASAAGVNGRPSGERVSQSGVVIVGDPLADDSARERARRVRRAMRSAGQDAEGVTHG